LYANLWRRNLISAGKKIRRQAAETINLFLPPPENFILGKFVVQIRKFILILIGHHVLSISNKIIGSVPTGLPGKCGAARNFLE
jgi:hypothetical protein